MKYQTATLTQQGGRAYNEDFCGSVELEDQLSYWVVADGLGGHGGGEVASQLAVEAMLNAIAESPQMSTETLALQFNTAQAAVIEGQKSAFKLARMHTTAVGLIIHHDQALWGHIGDSRLYYFHEGRLQSQTQDHSVPQLLVKAGEIEASEIRFHEDRNRLLRSIGSQETFKPQLEKKPLQLHSGDAFLLCSDGFWEYVFEDEMVSELTQASSASQWLKSLERRLLERVPEGNDNYTAIAILVSEYEAYTTQFASITIAIKEFTVWLYNAVTKGTITTRNLILAVPLVVCMRWICRRLRRVESMLPQTRLPRPGVMSEAGNAMRGLLSLWYGRKPA